MSLDPSGSRLAQREFVPTLLLPIIEAGRGYFAIHAMDDGEILLLEAVLNDLATRSALNRIDVLHVLVIEVTPVLLVLSRLPARCTAAAH